MIRYKLIVSLSYVAVDYIRDLIKDKDELKERARKLQTALGEV